MPKYDLQRLFERSDLEGDGLYRAIFMEDTHASQLVLPVLVGRRVHQAVKERIGNLRAREDGDQEGFSELNWLPFARMHIAALVGEQLRAGTSTEKGELLDASTSLDRWQAIGDWFDNTFSIARNAVEFYIEVEKRADKLHNLRGILPGTADCTT